MTFIGGLGLWRIRDRLGRSKINVFWFLALLFSPWAMVFYLDTMSYYILTMLSSTWPFGQ